MNLPLKHLPTFICEDWQEINGLNQKPGSWSHHLNYCDFHGTWNGHPLLKYLPRLQPPPSWPLLSRGGRGHVRPSGLKGSNDAKCSQCAGGILCPNWVQALVVLKACFKCINAIHQCNINYVYIRYIHIAPQNTENNQFFELYTQCILMITQKYYLQNYFLSTAVRMLVNVFLHQSFKPFLNVSSESPEILEQG